MPSVEVSTAAVMAAVSWLEGVARTTSGSIALRRTGLGPWRVHEPAELGAGWRIVAWWPPVTLALPLEPGMASAARGDEAHLGEARLGDARLAHRLRARARRTRVPVALLRVLGTLVLSTLVLGIPLATARLGAIGLAIGVLALLYLGGCTSVVTWVGLRRAGLRRTRLGRRAAIGPALRTLWPFAALRAAATVQGAVVAGAPAAVVVRTLLGDAAFAAWIRPALWDASRGAPGDDEPATPGTSATLAAEVAAALVRDGGWEAALAARAPADAAPGDAWCPRCARAYRARTAECAACPGVALVEVEAPAAVA